LRQILTDSDPLVG